MEGTSSRSEGTSRVDRSISDALKQVKESARTERGGFERGIEREGVTPRERPRMPSDGGPSRPPRGPASDQTAPTSRASAPYRAVFDRAEARDGSAAKSPENRDGTSTPRDAAEDRNSVFAAMNSTVRPSDWSGDAKAQVKAERAVGQWFNDTMAPPERGLHQTKQMLGTSSDGSVRVLPEGREYRSTYRVERNGNPLEVTFDADTPPTAQHVEGVSRGLEVAEAKLPSLAGAVKGVRFAGDKEHQRMLNGGSGVIGDHRKGTLVVSVPGIQEQSQAMAANGDGDNPVEAAQDGTTNAVASMVVDRMKPSDKLMASKVVGHEISHLEGSALDAELTLEVANALRDDSPSYLLTIADEALKRPVDA